MKRLARRGLWAGAILAVLGVVGFLGYFEAMKRGWIRANQYDNRSEGILQVGDPAPDLTLRKVDGAESIQLSSLYSRRPLALVFGSYT